MIFLSGVHIFYIFRVFPQLGYGAPEASARIENPNLRPFVDNLARLSINLLKKL